MDWALLLTIGVAVATSFLILVPLVLVVVDLVRWREWNTLATGLVILICIVLATTVIYIKIVEDKREVVFEEVKP